MRVNGSRTYGIASLLAFGAATLICSSCGDSAPVSGGPGASAGQSARTRAAPSPVSIRGNLDADHPIRVRGRLTLGGRVGMLHPGNPPAIDRVLPVQELIVLEVDEELAVGRVRILRPRHADDTAGQGHVREVRLPVGQRRSTNPRAADDAARAEWVERGDLANFRLTEGALPVIEKAFRLRSSDEDEN